MSIDPKSPTIPTTRIKDGRLLLLVASDEFEEDNRGFMSGADTMFEAIEKPDDTNQAIQFYNSSKEYVTTKDGKLTITTKAVKTSWVEMNTDTGKPHTMTKNYTSGMVQSWNKFCFTGGVIELSIKLPGKSDSGGLWPAVWLMGNLARATYDQSVMYVWPWSYDKCGYISYLDSKQEINACNENPGYGMHPKQGRGAPEIDILEVMPGHNMPGSDTPIRPFMSTSLQLSPGISKDKNRPKNGFKLDKSNTWYPNISIGHQGSDYNYGFWGQECGPERDDTWYQINKYMEDAISVNTFLNDTHFDTFHQYRLEWQPGVDGFLYWYLDGKLVFGIDGQSINKVTGAQIPVEPMYLVLNTAISHRWGMPEPCPKSECDMCWLCYDCTNPDCQCTLPDGMKNCKNLPAVMEIDYIRLYQDIHDKAHTLSCSPDAYPTKGFIEGHPNRYSNWSPYGAATVVGGADGLQWIDLSAIVIIFISIVVSTKYIYKIWLARDGYEPIDSTTSTATNYSSINSIVSVNMVSSSSGSGNNALMPEMIRLVKVQPNGAK